MMTFTNYNNYNAFDENFLFPTQCDYDIMNGVVDSTFNGDLSNFMDGYQDLTPDQWSPNNVFDWLTLTATNNGLNYETFVNARNYNHVDGKLLEKMGENNFIELTNSQEAGKKIYQAKKNLFDLLKRKRRRKPLNKEHIKKTKEKSFGKIWEFIAKLLSDKDTCPSLIKWDDYTTGTFKFVQPKKVAELWGKRKNNPRMDYNKFTRALRYHYKKGFLMSVEEKRLVYKFGPKAIELRNKFPNI